MSDNGKTPLIVWYYSESAFIFKAQNHHHTVILVTIFLYCYLWILLCWELCCENIVHSLGEDHMKIYSLLENFGGLSLTSVSVTVTVVVPESPPM